MMRKSLLFIAMFAFIASSFAQQKSSGLTYTAPKAQKTNVEKTINAAFSDGFELGFASQGWTVIDANADGTTWAIWSNANVPANSGDSLAGCLYTTAGNDDYLVTPQLTVATGEIFKFYASSQGTWLESYEVLVSTTGNAVADFTITLESVVDEPATYALHSFVLTDNANINDGDQVYIAFRCTSVDANVLKIDDVSLDAPATNPDASLSAGLASNYTIFPSFFTASFDFKGMLSNAGATIPSGQSTTADEATIPYAGTATTSSDLADGATVELVYTPSFTPSAVGAYQINFDADVTGDATPETNKDTLFVAISDTTLARDFGANGGAMGIGDGATGIVGQLYTFETGITLTSVTFQLMHPTAVEGTVKVYAFDGTTVTGSELATSALIGVGDVYLPAGTYFIGIDEASAGNMALATSTVPGNLGEAWVYYNAAWAAAASFGFNHTYVIRANITFNSGVNNTVATSEINIYPNPTTGLLNVTNAKDATINVYNTVGALVKTVSNTNTVDLSDVQNGTYIVKVITNNNVVVKNIVLAK